MRRTSRKVWRLTARTITVALVAACSTSPLTPPQNPVLTQPEANAVAEVVATDAASLVGGATLDAAAGMPFAVAPSPPTNSDGDPVPDSVRIDFTGCTFTGDAHSVTLSGSIDIVDPTPAITDRAFRTRSNAFTRTVTNAATGTTRSVVENGVRSVVGTSDQIQLTDTMQTDYTYATGATASHVRKWLATFAADQAGSIQMGSPLPSGNWSVSGSSTWTSGTNSYSLSVSTSDPLHYNASCTVEPRFDSGKLTAIVTKGTAATTVTIQFTACGQYTVTRS